MAKWKTGPNKRADGRVRVYKDTQARIAKRAKKSGKSAAALIDNWERNARS